MVISTNPNPDLRDFVNLLRITTDSLNADACDNEEFYISRAGNKLENVVCERMEHFARGSQFEGTIQLISGQKFPDIIAHRFYGVEVKSTTQNHWTTTGNSVLESTRVDGVERIYMFFGKLARPVEFRYRPYEECLSAVVVTHSPRYLVDMNLNRGETIFDKITLPYDTLRNLDDPIRPIVDYYRSQLREGEELWWIDSGANHEEAASNMAIRLWTNLTPQEKHDVIVSAMAYFPELFGNGGKKYGRLAVWLVSKFGIVSPSLRDSFTAGGQISFDFDGRRYENVPRIFEHLLKDARNIFAYIMTQDNAELSHYWGVAVNKGLNRLITWIELVSEYSATFGFNPKPILFRLLK